MNGSACPWRTPAVIASPAITFVLVAAMSGCGKGGPIQPSQVHRLVTITGITRLANPGDTAQLSAVTRYSDGTPGDVTADITREARWSAGLPIVTVSQGLLRAVAYGTTNVRASLSVGPDTYAEVAVRVQPEGTYFVKGRVTNEGAFPVANATVRVTSGAQTFAVKTDSRGEYLVPAVGESTLTVESDGYQAETQGLTVLEDGVVNVALQRAVRDGFNGYGLTITASASCTALPAGVMRRHYDATITEYGDGSLLVALSGADFFDMLAEPGFTGRREADHVRFDLAAITPGAVPRYAVVESLDSFTLLGYSGTAEGTIAGTSLVATLDGTISVTALQDGSTVSCKASDHRLELGWRLGT